MAQSNQNAPSNRNTQSNQTARSNRSTEPNQTAQSNQSTQNEPQQMAQATPNQAAPSTPARNQLPQTASNVPLLGLVGLIFLVAFGLTTVLAVR